MAYRSIRTCFVYSPRAPPPLLSPAPPPPPPLPPPARSLCSCDSTCRAVATPGVCARVSSAIFCSIVASLPSSSATRLSPRRTPPPPALPHARLLWRRRRMSLVLLPRRQRPPRPPALPPPSLLPALLEPLRLSRHPRCHHPRAKTAPPRQGWQNPLSRRRACQQVWEIGRE